MPRLIDADAMRQERLENGENEYIYDTNAVLDSIDSQPTVNQWIPVTERLPETNATVGIFTKSRSIYLGVYTVRHGTWREEGFIVAPGFMRISNVTHWMPMPEPPKGD